MLSRRNIRIELWLLAACVVIIGLFVTGDPAHAHDTPAPTLELAASEPLVDHSESGEDEQCHDGAFCNGPAIITGALDAVRPTVCAAREGLPLATRSHPAFHDFDPPPPRLLI